MPARATRLTTTLATYLYLSDATTDQLAGLTPIDRAQALGYIGQADQRFGFDAAEIALAETAYALGDHPETAMPRWTASLAAASSAETVVDQIITEQRAEVIL